MNIESFIESFKGQLEDANSVVGVTTDYVKADFWDSLTSMVVKVMIEDEYGVTLEVDEINNFSSIEELYLCVKNKVNG